MFVVERQSVLPYAAEDVAALLGRAHAFARLLPPWLRPRILEHVGGAAAGARLVFTVGSRPLAQTWRAEFGGDAATRLMRLRGPHAVCELTQRVVPLGAASCAVVDHVEYRPTGLPRGSHGARRELERALAFRHARLRADLDHHAVWADRPRLRVAIAGAHGLIGAHLWDYLDTAGHDVVRLVRGPVSHEDEFTWNPQAGTLDPAALEGVDAVVNLAGVNLATLWTAAKKTELRSSRILSTRTLARAMSAMEKPPAVFVSTSAVGIYGSRGDEVLTEESTRGTGFLADLCAEWEAEALAAAAAGVRVVMPRFGLVLSAVGGALATMLPPFRLGLAGRLGDGSQWWSWVALDDVLGALEWVLHD